MTKTELLELMQKYDACYEATAYVTQHPSDDASVVGVECTDVDWLIWLLGREKRLSRFVRVCALRAKKAAESCADSRYAAAYAADAASYAAFYASYAAADAASDAARAAYYAANASANADADATARATADAAYYYAAYYAAYADARSQESAAQLKGLRRIWIDWCAGKEAEK